MTTREQVAARMRANLDTMDRALWKRWYWKSLDDVTLPTIEEQVRRRMAANRKRMDDAFFTRACEEEAEAHYAAEEEPEYIDNGPFLLT